MSEAGFASAPGPNRAATHGSTATHSAVPEGIKGIRRTAVFVVIASLSIAALLGIIALFGGPWGDLQTKVLFTTLIIAAFSVVALINMVMFQTESQWLVWLSLLAALVGLVTALLLIWWLSDEWYRFDALIDGMAKACWTGWVVAVASTHANLMLFFARVGTRLVQVFAALTIICVSVIAGQLVFLVFGDLNFQAEAFFRLMGVLGILGVLGTIAVPVLVRVLGSGAAKVPAPFAHPVAHPVAAPPVAPHAPAAPALALNPALLQRLQARAAAEETTVEGLLERLLDR